MSTKTKGALARANKSCAYFPCHDGLEDCAFCYCPFYPCKDKRLGSYIITKDNRNIWSCKDCNWIHKKNTVEKIFNMIRNSNLKGGFTVRKPIAKNTGVIILGHGSKLKEANNLLLRVAKCIRHKNGFHIVEPAFLQLWRPGIQEVIKKVVKTGCRRIIIVPFFLFTGNHVKRDIPRVIKRETRMHKGIELVYAKNIGQDPRITNIVMDCIIEAAG